VQRYENNFIPAAKLAVKITDFCQMAEAEQTEVPVRRKGRTGTEIKIDVTDFRIT